MSEEKPLRICIICGKEFKRKKQSRAITCSKKCSKERKRRYNKKWQKKFQKENKDRVALYSRKWASRNKDKVNERSKRAYKRHKDKFLVRTKTRQNNEKIGKCFDCGKKGKTEFHHLSYEPNIFIELCKRCHYKRHGRELYVK